jgi:hypothetical protein
MFNGLDRLFELLNLRYRRESQNLLCFPKHHSITIYIYRERESERESKTNMLLGARNHEGVRSPFVILAQKIYQIIFKF